MTTAVFRSEIPVSTDVLFAWHERPGAFERLNPPFDPVHIEERSEGIQTGARTTIRVGPLRQKWLAEHTAYEHGQLFRDEMRSGPFRKWVHTHRFVPSAGGSTLVDEIDYELPLGSLGASVGGGFVERKLRRTFAFRHARTKADLVRHRPFPSTPLTVAVTGASGMIASSLIPFLTTGGHRVVPVRRTGSHLDAAAIDGVDAVVHLAGAGVADERWSAERKQMLVDSRVGYTRQLVDAIRRAKRPPRLLISGSAIGIYGDRGDETLTEGSVPAARADRGAAFLAGLCVDWEGEAVKAEALGVRVVSLRIGIVLSARGGALRKLLPVYLAGAGGPVGSGTQWMSWVGSDDVVYALHHALMTESLKGPINVVAPEPVTANAFARTLGTVLSRPAIARVPVFALRAAFGEMAEATVLSGARVRPEALITSGFRFEYPHLEGALRFELGRLGAA
jgi:hypothetical protein